MPAYIASNDLRNFGNYLRASCNPKRCVYAGVIDSSALLRHTSGLGNIARGGKSET